MSTAALLRYLAADAVRSQRWVAPAAVHLVAVAGGTAAGGTALEAYGLGAVLLLPVSVWLTVAVLNAEDDLRAAVTAVTAGGIDRVRLARLAVAAVGCAGLAAIGVVWPLVVSRPATPGDVLAGICGHALVVLTGVAAGGALARPLVRRPAWAVLGGTAFAVAEVAVPHAPPVRPIAELFSDATQPGDLAAGLATTAVATVALAAALIVLTGPAHRRRS